MAEGSTSLIDRILSSLPHRWRGPGGAVAILKDGEVIAQRCYGYANLDERAPMTPDTLIPICSISKQMVCLTLISLLRDPTPAMLARKEEPKQQMNAELKKLLPHLVDRPGEELTLEHLCHMQSGIRDYWGMTTLFGARPDGFFSLVHDGKKALDRTRSFHFKPGSTYSYSNVNFHIIGRILENVSGRSLGQLLTERVFIPAGMSSAALCPNTNGLPQPIVGYEGNESVGYFAATNRIEWSGDAGVVASLNDMIAYEKFLDKSYSDASSLYHQTSQQQTFKDGSPAEYGYGLFSMKTAGREVVGHGGALRGFRLDRVHVPSERLNIVVMLNHEVQGPPDASDIFELIIGSQQDSAAPSIPDVPAEWEGDWLEEGTQLNIHIEKSTEPGEISLRYRNSPETLKLKSKTEAQSVDVSASLDGDILNLERRDENVKQRARRIARPTDGQRHNAKSSDYVGVYRCEEVDSTFHCSGEHGTLYGAFDGFLGKGPIWLMRYLGESIWVLGTPRGMDAGPPGDWTCVFHRGADGSVTGVTIGCWLARKVEFVKQSQLPVR